MSRSFQLIDVFGQEDFSGNPLAVVMAAEGLDAATMQRITRWLNLSETAFLLPSSSEGADYRVRIFTLERELPFAGHPTLGSCHAWLAAGGRPQHEAEPVQQCAAGLVRLRRDGGRLAFAAPPLLRSGPVDEARRREVLDVLRIAASEIVDMQWVDNGPGWIAVLLRSADAVLAIEPLRSAPGETALGIVGPHAVGGPAAFEIRALFSDAHGAIIEDPVTGSLNASVAQWLFACGRATDGYIAAQGTRLGRQGRVHVDRDADGQVWIGGATRTLVRGEIAA